MHVSEWAPIHLTISNIRAYIYTQCAIYKMPQKYAFQKTHDENCEQKMVNSIIQILILELIM